MPSSRVLVSVSKGNFLDHSEKCEENTNTFQLRSFLHWKRDFPLPGGLAILLVQIQSLQSTLGRRRDLLGNRRYHRRSGSGRVHWGRVSELLVG